MSSTFIHKDFPVHQIEKLMLSYIHQANIPVAEKTHFAKCALVQECTHGDKNSGLLTVLTVKV